MSVDELKNEKACMCPYGEADTRPSPMGEWKWELGAPSISPKDSSVQRIPAAALYQGCLETALRRDWLLRFLFQFVAVGWGKEDKKESEGGKDSTLEQTGN